MGNVKWIKITVDVFNDQKILMIESLPDADSIIVIWFKLLCLAGQENNGGVFLFRENMPYTDEMLAAIFRRPINTVRMALKTFEQYGMIEITEDVICIPKWNEYQKLTELEAQKEQNRLRQKNFRDKQKLAIAEAMTPHDDESNVTHNVTPVTDNATSNVTSNVTHNVTVTQMSRNVTPLDIDIDIERDIDKERYIDNTNLYSGSKVGESLPDSADSDESTPSPKARKPKKEDVPEEPAVISIELNDGSLYGVTQSEIDYYKTLYPAVDIMQTMRNIAGWNHSHKTQRKTKAGIRKHINTWLAKEQDRGGRRGTGQTQSAYTYDYNSYDDSCPY